MKDSTMNKRFLVVILFLNIFTGAYAGQAQTRPAKPVVAEPAALVLPDYPLEEVIRLVAQGAGKMAGAQKSNRVTYGVIAAATTAILYNSHANVAAPQAVAHVARSRSGSNASAGSAASQRPPSAGNAMMNYAGKLLVDIVKSFVIPQIINEAYNRAINLATASPQASGLQSFLEYIAKETDLIDTGNFVYLSSLMYQMHEDAEFIADAEKCVRTMMLNAFQIAKFVFRYNTDNAITNEAKKAARQKCLSNLYELIRDLKRMQLYSHTENSSKDILIQELALEGGNKAQLHHQLQGRLAEIIRSYMGAI